MKIAKLLRSESTNTEYVFETDPPLTQEVMDEYNRRDNDTSRHFVQRDGKLVLTSQQVQAMRASSWTREPAQVLSEFLTEAEEHLQREDDNRKQNFDRRMKDTAKFFGVPAE